MSVGDNIKSIRKERKLTQEKLANDMGISRSYLSDIENNRKNPSTKTLQSISNKLNISMYYLTTGEKKISDLTNDEGIEIIQNTLTHMKEEILEIVSSELNTYETNFLSAMVRFLKSAKKDEIVGMSLIVLSLKKYIDYKKDGKLNKDEIEFLLKHTSEEVIEFIHEYFQ